MTKKKPEVSQPEVALDRDPSAGGALPPSRAELRERRRLTLNSSTWPIASEALERVVGKITCEGITPRYVRVTVEYLLDEDRAPGQATQTPRIFVAGWTPGPRED